MIARNVLHRPVRTLVSVVAVGIEVALVILVVGLVTGLITESASRQEALGADVMVQPPAASFLTGFTNAPMPIAIGRKIQQLDYVNAVAPVFMLFNVQGVDMVYGIDPASFRAVSGGFALLSGHGLQKPDDVLVDDMYAGSKHVRVGQTIQLFSHDFRVAGIVEHGKGGRVYVLLSTLQDLASQKDKANVFYVKADRSDHTLAIENEIKQLLPGYKVLNMKEFMSLMTSTSLPGLGAFITVMIGIAVVIGFLVIFLAMYTTIIERTREIGVLKSLGASKNYIIQIILSETALLCSGGIAVGVGLSFGGKAAFSRLYPTLTFLIMPKWVAYAALIAIGGGLLGATYPAWLASRKDPVEALSYE